MAEQDKRELPLSPRTEQPRGRRKTAIGYVVSDKMQE